MDPTDHLPLAPRDLLILAVLSEGPTHGYGLIKSVEARSRAGVLLDPANLYRVLRRMRNDGWIRQTRSEATPTEATPTAANPRGIAETDGNDGARRRTYEITSEGRSILAAELSRLELLLEQARSTASRT
ncbi:MAG TPA: PadR family transcriptional regulator [Thermoanaerobaculia bacterium]|nr:PadR family transcriptional regulator [Thermoanaerobaculia bacterium]